MDRWCRMPNANLMLFYSLHSWQTYTYKFERIQNLDLEVTTLSNYSNMRDLLSRKETLFRNVLYCKKKTVNRREHENPYIIINI